MPISRGGLDPLPGKVFGYSRESSLRTRLYSLNFTEGFIDLLNFFPPEGSSSVDRREEYKFFLRRYLSVESVLWLFGMPWS
jgi:hypothetical protein